jgi:hypothetical protein
MLPGVIEVEPRFVAPTFVTDPFAVVVDVRGFRVPLTVVEGARGCIFVRFAVRSRGTMMRHVSAAYIVVTVAVVAVIFSLRQGWQGKNQSCGKNSGE